MFSIWLSISTDKCTQPAEGPDSTTVCSSYCMCRLCWAAVVTLLFNVQLLVWLIFPICTYNVSSELLCSLAACSLRNSRSHLCLRAVQVIQSLIQHSEFNTIHTETQTFLFTLLFKTALPIESYVRANSFIFRLFKLWSGRSPCHIRSGWHHEQITFHI